MTRPDPRARARPTSRDVAQHAGVSQSTVSHVLTGTGRISAATRARVLESAATLGFRPNLTARSMRTGRTGRLAILLPAPGEARSGMLSAAGQAAADAGFALEIRTIGGGAERHDDVSAVLGSGLYEGVLSFVPTGEIGTSAASSAPGAGAVGVGAGGVGAVGRLPAVVDLSDTFDSHMRVIGGALGAEPVRELVAGLAARGYRNFLHLAGDLAHRSAQARRDAYREAVAAAGLVDLGVIVCNWDGQRALTAVRELASGGRLGRGILASAESTGGDDHAQRHAPGAGRVGAPAHGPRPAERLAQGGDRRERLAIVTGADRVGAPAHGPRPADRLAIVAASDLLATAAIRALLELGWRVPTDAGVTGWDNIVTGPFQTPSLTSVEVDFAAFGTWAMRTLIATVRGGPAPADPGPFQRVHWRESTG